MAQRLLEATEMSIDYLCTVGTEKAVWSIHATPVINLDFNGIPGDRHYGPTRVLKPYMSTELAGREVVNDRQLIIAQKSDMANIAHFIELPVNEIEELTGKSIAHYMAEQLAINVLVDSPVDGELSNIATSGLVLVLGNDPVTAPAMKLSEYSRPCFQPITQFAASLGALGLALPAPRQELAETFKIAAKDGRGWFGSVHAIGNVSVGETISAYHSLLPKE